MYSIDEVLACLWVLKFFGYFSINPTIRINFSNFEKNISFKMYKYINPKGKFIAEYTELGGKELVYEVLKMIPEDYKKRVIALEKAISEFDYPAIQMEVHTIKANFRQIVEVDNEFMIFLQKFEDDSRVISEKADKNIAIQNPVDFSGYFTRFKMESDLLAMEIDHFADTME